MFYVNREIDYALQLMIALAHAGDDPLSIRSFSEQADISFLFLQKIAKKLREADLIEAIKGSHGGYRLSHSSHTITLYQIWEAVLGSFGIVDCAKKGRICPKSGHCTSQTILYHLNTRMQDSLKETTLFDCMSMNKHTDMFSA